jgi:glycerophosphoryl diester phosphodiesterase
MSGPMPAAKERPLVLGHRGFRARFPENTLLAFQKALAFGAEGVECDLQKTADGRFVIIHDETVDRVSGQSGNVGAMSFEALRRVDVGSGERIPSLEELLEALPRGSYLDLELKDETITPADGPAIEKALAPGIDRASLMISSFEPSLLFHFRRRGYTVGLLLGEERLARGAVRLLPLLLRLRPQYANLPVDVVREPGSRRVRMLLGVLRFLGITVLLWTVNEAADAAASFTKARIIVTDQVERMVSLRNARG